MTSSQVTVSELLITFVRTLQLIKPIQSEAVVAALSVVEIVKLQLYGDGTILNQSAKEKPRKRK